ncbi:unnamed protein product [Amaranthus hypochondriacus]
MEAFSLLKYWKSTSGSGALLSPHTSLPTSASSTTTIVTSVSDHDSDDTADNDGPFFDLEFTVPAEYVENETESDDENEEEKEAEVIDELDEVEVEEERSLQDNNLTLSPSDDLFFNGRIVRIDNSEQSGDKPGQFPIPIPISLFKSASKFRVFILGLKRSKSESKQCPPPPISSPQNQNRYYSSSTNKKFFAVRFKVDDVPVLSLLTRASSNSKSPPPILNEAEDDGKRPQQQKTEERDNNDAKKNTAKKEVVQKYLKMVKIKVSKKNQKATAKEKKEKNMRLKQRVNLKVMAKRNLRKSNSAVVHSNDTTSSKKRDDSLLHQDGIESAILHCKRSFNSSKDFLDGEEASSDSLTQLVTQSLDGHGKEASTEENRNGVVVVTS